ncbi:MAG: histidine ammonia-lyase [Treponema sp.]|nr:MAG: histidine ammonia-lyase [Treponema sp.]
MNNCIITGSGLTVEDVVNVARFNAKVEISETSRKKIQDSKKIVNKIVESGVPTYGISTGFGELSTVSISKEENCALQRNLILSHACGVGEPFCEDVVRAIMLLRLNTLASGFSGVTPDATEILAELLNKGITPKVPSKGSLGSSGDLANLAHIVLVMIGEGEAYYKGKLMSGKDALKKADIKPVVLSGKDGLALINGTQVMTALGALAVYDAENLMTAANMAAALTFEAFRGITAALDPRLHAVRPHPGQIKTAEFILKMLTGSSSVNTRPNDVQDPYTLRCVPQVHGASDDSIQYVKKVIEIEINSVTDNPIVFPDNNDVISGGNFHGQPIALNMDFLGIAVSELANISERRTERLVNPQLNGGLPAFLIEKSGVNSGFMIPQYTAACLVSENKVLAHPASVDSITSSANKEDHVSMGTTAARKLAEIVKNVRNVIAIEWMVAAQACDLREIKTLGAGTAEMQKLIRENVDKVIEDRVFAGDMKKLAEVIFDRNNLDRIKSKLK